MNEVKEDNVVGKVVELSIDDILPNRYQPRIKFDDSAIFELSESIKVHGVFQPIIVRPIGDKYEIIAGGRRYKASVLANKKTIPAIIMDLNDKDTIEIALIENVQRANLTPIEEAITYKKILDMGYINQDDLAKKLGKTQSTVANKLRLLNLDEDVQEALLDNKISERHARSLLRLKSYDDQKILLKRIVNERLTVRKTDEEIDKMINGDNTTSKVNVSGPVVIDDINQNNSSNEEINSSSFVEEPVTTNSVFGFSGNNEVINANPVFENANTSTVMDVAPSQVAPSFVEPTIMNVDKIEDIATDKNKDTPVNEVEQPGKFFNFFNNSDVSSSKEETQENESKNFTFDNLYNDVKPVENVENPVSASPSFDNFFNNASSTMPSNDDNDDIVIPSTTSNPFGFDNNTQSSTVSEPKVTVPNSEPIPNVEPASVQLNGSKNVMSAVSIIRDAVNKLENLGYKVDCDEIDLETMYQMIVKIEKD